MQYFNEKFGFEHPETNPKLLTQLISTNPDAGMRCYVLGGETVPDEGYSVEDGSWMITVNDTQGKSGVYKNVKVDYIMAAGWQSWLLSYISSNNMKRASSISTTTVQSLRIPQNIQQKSYVLSLTEKLPNCYQC